MGMRKDIDAELRQEENVRMAQDDWPRCVRCANPIDFDWVELKDGKPTEDHPLCCSYCVHISSKDD